MWGPHSMQRCEDEEHICLPILAPRRYRLQALSRFLWKGPCVMTNSAPRFVLHCLLRKTFPPLACAGWLPIVLLLTLCSGSVVHGGLSLLP